MPTEIARYQSTEEEELASKRRELAALLADLAERELSLTNLKAELATFEGQYLRAVGVLYAELYEWNARITELIAAWDGATEALAPYIKTARCLFRQPLQLIPARLSSLEPSSSLESTGTGSICRCRSY
jgi:hypothetical protein